MAITASSGPGVRTATRSTRTSPAPWATTAVVLEVMEVPFSDDGSDDGRHAAVDEDDLAVDVVGGAGGQPHGRADHIGHRPPPASGGPAEDPRVELVVVHKVLGHLGVDVSGGDAVDLESLAG